MKLKFDKFKKIKSPLKSVGYKEIFEYLSVINLDEKY